MPAEQIGTILEKMDRRKKMPFLCIKDGLEKLAIFPKPFLVTDLQTQMNTVIQKDNLRTGVTNCSIDVPNKYKPPRAVFVFKNGKDETFDPFEDAVRAYHGKNDRVLDVKHEKYLELMRRAIVNQLNQYIAVPTTVTLEAFIVFREFGDSTFRILKNCAVNNKDRDWYVDNEAEFAFYCGKLAAKIPPSPPAEAVTVTAEEGDQAMRDAYREAAKGFDFQDRLISAIRLIIPRSEFERAKALVHDDQPIIGLSPGTEKLIKRIRIDEGARNQFDYALGIILTDDKSSKALERTEGQEMLPEELEFALKLVDDSISSSEVAHFAERVFAAYRARVAAGPAEVAVAPTTGTERYDSPSWRHAVSLLEQISWGNAQETINQNLKKAIFDIYQAANKENGILVQESVKRIGFKDAKRQKKDKDENTGRISHLSQAIDRFEELARGIDPVKLTELLQQGVAYTNHEPDPEAVEKLIGRIRGAGLAFEDRTKPVVYPDREALFVENWLYLTLKYTGIRQILERKQNKQPDKLLTNELTRLAKHPLIGRLEDHVESVFGPVRQIRQKIPPEQAIYINDERWIRVLEMMDMMDRVHETGENSPHLVEVQDRSFHHPKQNLEYPLPDANGQISDYQRQITESVRLVRELEREIDPQVILNFPKVANAASVSVRIPFFKEYDDLWQDDVRYISELLEKSGPDGEGLDYTIRNINIQRLSPREKLAAYLLLRQRISDLAGGMMGDILAVNEGISELPENIGNLIQKSLDKLQGSNIHTFLVSQMNFGQTGAQWLEQIIQDPLFTSTNPDYVGKTNKFRNKFIEKAKIVSRVKIPVE